MQAILRMSLFGPLLLLGVFACSPALADGLIGALTNSVRNGDYPDQPESRPKPKSSRHFHGHGCECLECDADSGWAEPLGWLLGIGLAAPYWGPVAAIGDDYSAVGYFPAHPYQGDAVGSMMILPHVPEEPYGWSGRASFDFGTDFNDFTSYRGKFLAETSSRFGIDGEVTYWTESLAAGGNDDLWTGDINGVFRFAQSEHWQLRSGVGVNWLDDGVDDNFGFNFTYGGDYFPVKPWVFSSELDWGRIGDAHLLHLRTTVGVTYECGEIYAGFDYYDVGPVEISSVIAGFRVWF
ncbi:MAG: hypothetical protein QGG36_25685 [Pirellulaceae bacterium]|nr:hypothetical protein [Pirellulaceae bacterium]